MINVCTICSCYVNILDDFWGALDIIFIHRWDKTKLVAKFENWAPMFPPWGGGRFHYDTETVKKYELLAYKK